MQENQRLEALKARFVFPVSGPPIADGFVTICGTQIVEVGNHPPDCPVRDLGHAAILPGLVNAHAHLEFSDLGAPLGHAGIALPDWIRTVMAYRREATSRARSGVARGLRESLAAGVTTLGEIATSDWTLDPLAMSEAKLDVMMFFEIIAPTEARQAAGMEAAEVFLQRPDLQSGIARALSPHAPYTVRPDALREAVELAERFSVPLAMHLAESPEEIELLASGSGGMRQLLDQLGSWDPRPTARYARVLSYLEQLARAPRALVIHGNYLDREEIEFLAARSERMSVVYCPRTHAFFGHAAYPLSAMLASGVSLALGTDSRASNPDLDLLAEMRFVAEHYPQIGLSKVVELGTVCGARAVGLADRIGTIEAGKRADLAVVGLARDATAGPYESLFAPQNIMAETWVRGERVYIASQI